MPACMSSSPRDHRIEVLAIDVGTTALVLPRGELHGRARVGHNTGTLAWDGRRKAPVKPELSTYPLTDSPTPFILPSPSCFPGLFVRAARGCHVRSPRSLSKDFSLFFPFRCYPSLLGLLPADTCCYLSSRSFRNLAPWHVSVTFAVHSGG